MTYDTANSSTGSGKESDGGEGGILREEVPAVTSVAAAVESLASAAGSAVAAGLTGIVSGAMTVATVVTSAAAVTVTAGATVAAGAVAGPVAAAALGGMALVASGTPAAVCNAAASATASASASSIADASAALSTAAAALLPTAATSPLSPPLRQADGRNGRAAVATLQLVCNPHLRADGVFARPFLVLGAAVGACLVSSRAFGVPFEHGAVQGVGRGGGGEEELEEEEASELCDDDEAAGADGTADKIEGEDVGWFMALSQQAEGPMHVLCLDGHEVEHCNEEVGFCTPEEYSDVDRYRLA